MQKCHVPLLGLRYWTALCLARRSMSAFGTKRTAARVEKLNLLLTMRSPNRRRLARRVTSSSGANRCSEKAIW